MTQHDGAYLVIAFHRWPGPKQPRRTIIGIFPSLYRAHHDTFADYGSEEWRNWRTVYIKLKEAPCPTPCSSPPRAALTTPLASSSSPPGSPTTTSSSPTSSATGAGTTSQSTAPRSKP